MNKKIRLFSIICLSVLLLALLVFAGCAEKQKQNGETSQDSAGTETICEHSWVTISETQPTCTDRGHREQVCVLCGITEESSFGTALGHEYGDWVTEREATCGESGLNTRTCSRCGHKEQEVLFVQHHYEIGETFTPDADECLVQGYTEYVCKDCGDTYRSYTDVTGHTAADGSEKIVAATCTAGGYIEYTCSKCGVTYVDDETEALGHDYQPGETVPATCSGIGGTPLTCSRCHSVTYADIRPKLAHAFGDDGICTSCGKYVTEAIILEGDSDNAYVLGDATYEYIVYAPDGSEVHYVKIGREAVDALIAEGYYTLTVSFGSPDRYYRAFSCELPDGTKQDANCWTYEGFAASMFDFTFQIADENGNIKSELIDENGLRFSIVYRDANGVGNGDRGKGTLDRYAMKIAFTRAYIENDRSTWIENSQGVEADADNENTWIVSMAFDMPAVPVTLRVGAVRWFAEHGATSLKIDFLPKDGQGTSFAVQEGESAEKYGNNSLSIEVAITDAAKSDGIVLNVRIGNFYSEVDPDGFVMVITPIGGEA